MITKERVILSLFGVAAALLVLNIFIKNTEPAVVRNFPQKVSREQVDSLLTLKLTEFGLTQEWYKRISISNKNYDSLKYVYHISVPSDLPLIYLLGEIQKGFAKLDVQLKISERKQNRESDIKFFRNGFLSTQAIFKRDREKSRSAGKIRLIILNDNRNIRNSGYLKLPFSLSIAIRPSVENTAIADSIIGTGKGFVVLIDDNISDSEFLLEESLGRRKLKSSVNKICSDFESAGMFIVDGRSEIFNSISYNLIRDQFRGNNISLRRLKEFQRFSEGDRAEIISRFRFLIENLNPGEDKQLVIESGVFPILRSEIDRAIKLGVKFVN